MDVIGSPHSPPGTEFRQLIAMLPAGTRAQALRLLALMLATGVAEMVTIGSVVPFLALLTRQDGAARAPAILPFLPQSLGGATALFLAAVAIAGAMRLLLSWSTQRFALGAGHWVAAEVQRHVLLQPYSWHVQAHSSTLVAALQKVQDLVWGVLIPLMQGAAAAVMAVLILGVLLWVNPFAASAAAVLFGGLYVLVSLLIRRRLRRDSAIVGGAYDERIRIVQDSLGGIRDIIIDGSQPVHLSAFRTVDRRFAEARARLGFLGSAPRYIIESIGLAIILLLTLVLADREGGLIAALPLLGALALGAQRLLPLIQQIYQSWSAASGNSRVIDDLARLLTLPVEKTADSPPAPLPFRSELRLEKVSFRYPGRDLPALADVALTIRKGSRTALIGRTGSGKSTLADLIMGLLAPGSGRILVDGEELTPANMAGWRRNIAHVPQSIFLTDASIAENIAFGVPAEQIDQARLLSAVRTAQLDDLIGELRQGLQTPVGERGVRLSGGQRQRLALARAIYRDKPVLVLDEATSALDAATESAVLHALDELQRQGVTILVIAHRTSTLAGCDQVVRLEAGRVMPAEVRV